MPFDVCLLKDMSGSVPVLLGASPYQKALRHLQPHWVFPFIAYGWTQLYVARVVTYTTAAFEHDREFTGQGVLHLFASSDQTAMDIMAKLTLLPEGEGAPPFIKVSQGWLRVSHRAEDPALSTHMRPFHRYRLADPIAPIEVYGLRVELMPMSVLVRKRDRLKLKLGNSASALTEAPMSHWYSQNVGTDTYHDTAARPSRLRLQERPRAAASASTGDEL